jgi:hypothetical protein
MRMLSADTLLLCSHAWTAVMESWGGAKKSLFAGGSVSNAVDSVVERGRVLRAVLR